jgi:hypothetical protein
VPLQTLQIPLQQRAKPTNLRTAKKVKALRIFFRVYVFMRDFSAIQLPAHSRFVVPAQENEGSRSSCASFFIIIHDLGTKRSFKKLH